MMSRRSTSKVSVFSPIHNHDDLGPGDSASQVGHSSLLSTTSSVATRRLKIAAAKARLEAELALEAEQQAMELEELRLQQRKQSLGIKSRLAVMNAEDEALARADELGLSGGSDSNHSIKSQLDNNALAQFSPNHNISDEEIVFKKACDLPVPAGPTHGQEAILQIVSEGQKQQRELIDAIRLPAAQLIPYDGDPLRYWTFVRSFENCVASSSVDDGAKLARLIQYCTGKARKVIECCSIMNPQAGYEKAKQLLKERFGDDFSIAEAWIRKVTANRVSKPYDKERLQEFADDLLCCRETLAAMGYLGELNGQSTLLKIVEQLPNYLQLRFKREVRHVRDRHKRNPNIDDVVEFVREAAAEANDPVYGNLAQRDDRPNTSVRRPTVRDRGAVFVATSLKNDHTQDQHQTPNRQQFTQVCILCGENHTLFRCDQFKSSNVDQRIDLVKRHNLCFNCLKPGHTSNRCQLTRTCSVPGCNKRHTKFLHPVITSSPAGQHTNTREMQVSSQHSSIECSSNNNCIGAGTSVKTALPIVPVIVSNPITERTFTTYALLDTGSTNTFCSNELAMNLGLSGPDATLFLTTLEKANSAMPTTMVSLDVCGLNGSQIVNLPVVYTREHIPISLHNVPVLDDVRQWQHLQDIDVPDDVNINKVTLLIGQDVPDALIPLEIRRGEVGSNAPYAVRTSLGWALNGPLGRKAGDRRVTVNFIDFGLEQQVERLWKLDQVKQTEDMSHNDLKAISVWRDTIKYEGGHYEVGIPFKRHPKALPDNKLMAQQRLRSLKCKLTRNHELHGRYSNYMDELIEKKYAEKVCDEGEPGSVWYLPHHAVHNVNKPDKVRIVFDCSAKCGGTSLNENVLQGPDMTNALIGVLLRFRQDRIAIMADIESMFHQVKVSSSDRDVLRFLWWPKGDLDGDPAVYRMTVHLFGGIWSPSCCNFILRHTAEDHRSEFSEDTVKTVFNSFYVDDCLKSVPIVEEAIQLVNNLSTLLQKGGFKLTKWVSNSKEVSSTIPDDRLKQLCPTERALGVSWDVDADCLGFIAVDKDRPLTRRGILSVISGVFDPLGLIGPFVLPARRILQELCRKNIGWDDKLPDSELDSWQAWYNDQAKLKDIKVRRCLKPDKQDASATYQLHHFSDASSYGYGTATYLRTVNSDGQVTCALVMARSRLAPIKSTTIPRLELSAATLAVKIDAMITSELDIPLEASVFWTDSTVVLQYINNVSKKFQTFVANRVAAIHEGSLPTQWRYVDTKSNPADDASRGLRAEEMINNRRWFTGPNFLKESEDSWPINPINLGEPLHTDPEVKKDCIIYSTSTASSEDMIINKMFSRYSDWYRLKKTVAWLLRIKNYLKNKAFNHPMSNMTDPLSVAELQQSEMEIVKYIQRQAFGNENKQICESFKKGQLHRLEPFISEDDVVCVGGRLRSHHAILPKCHDVVILIIRHFHEVSGHSGREHTLALIRRRYWILGARSIVRKVLKECTRCRLRNPKPIGQRMANLPKERVTALEPPFTSVGVDIFGPFIVKRGRCEYKRYGCLFTCLAIRAVHIEVVHSMETDSFIQALQRFVCRRGQVKMIRSDNGTNFVGAAKELRQAVGKWNQTRIDNFLRQREIQWHFNPPAASHMGGVWERQIRTVRKILNALMNEQTVSDEGLTTLMCLVESVINSRPLTTISDDHRDLEPLTPNHLLLLRPEATLHAGESVEQDLFSRKCWRQVQYLADVFWRRWTREYLPTLQLRQKWFTAERNIEAGDIVVVIDPNMPRNTWSLGRVDETYPGSDGLVRSAKVTTRTATLTRPVHKLSLLERVDA